VPDVSSDGTQLPDYDLEELRVVSSPAEVKGLFDPLRSTLLELLLERAATVAELAEAVGRPKSTVAYHVDALVRADLLKVVRTRRVRAIDERWYGRTARLFYVGRIEPELQTEVTNYLTVAASESVPAHDVDRLRAVLRYSRIPNEAAEAFWQKVFDVVNEFSQLPRSGDQVFGFVAGMYPTEHPTLPDRRDPDPSTGG
jgi:DNA-binding transcriptional ArsR family regulator